ncbi:DUF1460 domain-containing protein [Salmonella enterica subsp. enterica serovar Sandiego]|nr:DUF1460 domain-containing protein [Salmonella enterica subsp. enterica serovar Sandiego]
MLGQLTIAEINSTLTAKDQLDNIHDQFKCVIQLFSRGTFQFEPSLKILPPGIVRVNLVSFDCITFIYHTLALLIGNNFDNYVEQYVRLRYSLHEAPRGGVDINNDPEHGNIFDYVCESLLINAIQNNTLKDINTQVFSHSTLMTLHAHLRKVPRNYLIDKEQHIISPKLGQSTKISYKFIPSNKLNNIDMLKLRTGDIAILTKGNPKHQLDLLVNHVVFVYMDGKQCRFIHAGKNYIVNPDVEQSPLKQQLGVSFGLKYAGDEYTRYIDGVYYYGYQRDQHDELFRYIASNFNGVAFLRLSKVMD